MNGVKLSELATISGGHLEGSDQEITSVSTDSRSVGKGDVYFCLRGENFDGHDFALQSLVAGATAVVTETALDTDQTQLVVPDTRKAYGYVASLWRQQLDLKLIGITGSNGKTTVKQLIAGICGVHEHVHFTRANDNNEIGVPQTLLGLSKNHTAAVVEMGANQPGEIAWLSSISKPTVALITNVSASHLEGFGTVDKVAREKAAIYDGLSADGVAVINADDKFSSLWTSLNQNRTTLLFGLSGNADISASRIAANRLAIRHGVKKIECSFALPGQHNVANAAAAAAACIAAGITLENVALGLQTIEAVPGRLNFHHLKNDVVVIDDTYNANPASTRAAIDVLCESSGLRWVILGDLRELGDNAIPEHRQIGEYASARAVDRFLNVGSLTRHAAKAYGKSSEWFDTKEALLESIEGDVPAGTTILVKGSRSMHMESIVQQLLSSDSITCADAAEVAGSESRA